MEDPALEAAQRVEGWAGEVRVNLIRLLAIALFYGQHLLAYHFLGVGLSREYRLAATALAVAWAAGALGLHLGLSRRWNPPYLAYAAATGDALMTTLVLLISGGPRSPFLFVLFLLVMTSLLRLRLRPVWATALLALLSYAVVCGHARWVRPEWRVERREQVIVALGLICAGLLAGQAVRQARRFAQDYAERVRPESPSP